MTPEEINERIAEIIGVHNTVGLKKRGLWYRPNARGYTTNESEAGRYSLKEAQEHAHPDGEPVTIHRFKTPNYYGSLDACREFEKGFGANETTKYTHEILCHTVWKTMRTWDSNDDRDDEIRTALTLQASPEIRCASFLNMVDTWWPTTDRVKGTK